MFRVSFARASGRASLLALLSTTALPFCARAEPVLYTPPAEDDIVVTAQRLSEVRNGIQTKTGASTYTIDADSIANQPGGDNNPLSDIVLRAPGVVQDSFGQLHVRAEHNALQYRLNGIILPEGLNVFSQSLNPRLAEKVDLITGALPAEYGLRTGGIIDIATKSGLFKPGGAVSIYGGSHDTIQPSFEYSGSSGHLNFCRAGSASTRPMGARPRYMTGRGRIRVSPISKTSSIHAARSRSSSAPRMRPIRSRTRPARTPPRSASTSTA
jgi:hypothetical protein